MSEKHRHTPGPWQPTVLRYPDGQLNGVPYVYAPNGDDGGRHVCEVYNNGQLDANARLIAAAPELAEALRGLVDSLESDIGLSVDHSVDVDEPGHAESCELCKARAVLAKLEA